MLYTVETRILETLAAEDYAGQTEIGESHDADGYDYCFHFPGVLSMCRRRSGRPMCKHYHESNAMHTPTTSIMLLCDLGHSKNHPLASFTSYNAVVLTFSGDYFVHKGPIFRSGCYSRCIVSRLARIRYPSRMRR